jgi:phosphoribosylpyrophosphate synthetase
LEETLALVPWLSRRLRRSLRATDAPLAPRAASDRRFDVVDPVQGFRIVLLDDTMTSGASIQSAASALQQAGATVVAAVPIARLIDPEYSPAVWRRSKSTAYDFNTCCLEGRAVADDISVRGGRP